MSSIQPPPSVEESANAQQKEAALANAHDAAVHEVAPTAAGEAKLLVSEFPPPPYYYRLAGSGMVLQPPPIPTKAITRGTERAAAIAARAREAERQLRIAELRRGDDSRMPDDPDDDIDKTDSILGGVARMDGTNDDGDVVAVFGEIVEDPLLVEPLDDCDDPMVVRAEVQRLHQIVLRTFVRMVQDLVHRPLENKLSRDELSHNIFLMLQECNKFREHQSREVLIEMLEEQRAERQMLLKQLREQISKSKAALL